MSEEKQRGPLTFEISKWYGYVLAAMYILYGGVQIILGFLDHSYDKWQSWLIFLLIGVIIVTIATGYGDQRKWGWAGMVGMTGLIILMAAINLSEAMNWVLLILSMAAMVLLFAPPTRAYIDGHR
ncbi:hypothetical protein GF420_02075 [candidate division GN15 bacterium]|nr:hypothetical protein [candidate division GN15 bacterium]